MNLKSPAENLLDLYAMCQNSQVHTCVNTTSLKSVFKNINMKNPPQKIFTMATKVIEIHLAQNQSLNSLQSFNFVSLMLIRLKIFGERYTFLEIKYVSCTSTKNKTVVNKIEILFFYQGSQMVQFFHVITVDYV